MLLTGALLYAVFFSGARNANPLTMILVLAFTFIPVAGVAEQALASALGATLAVGALRRRAGQRRFACAFPRSARPAGAKAPRRATVSAKSASWIALRATLVVMPVFVLALTNPVLLPGGHHEDGGAGPAGRLHQRPRGRAGTPGVHAHGRS